MNSNTNQTIEKFNQYHQSSTFSKVQYNAATADWLKSIADKDEWRLFTCTVVFKPIDRINTQERYESEYRGRFLSKIRRSLERSSEYQTVAIPYEYLYYYERYEKSRVKACGKKYPPHIHSLLPIKTIQVHRFWSYDENKLESRLLKDLKSIDIVEDVQIEPVRENESFPWLMYITKQKSI